MKKKSIVLFSLGGALLVLFAIFTALLKVCDVKTVTYPETALTSAVGFGSINLAIFKALGQNGIWYTVTELLGYLALLLAATFAVIGLIQWIRRKKLWSVDHEILLLAVFYIAVMFFYVLFEIVEINYRPILVDGELEASYPSSHSMLALCIFISANAVVQKLFRHRVLFLTVTTVLDFCATITVIGRLCSGVHWFTDIVGAVLLSSALVLLYFAGVSVWKNKNTKA